MNNAFKSQDNYPRERDGERPDALSGSFRKKSVSSGNMGQSSYIYFDFVRFLQATGNRTQ